jgi:hypothetical protein
MKLIRRDSGKNQAAPIPAAILFYGQRKDYKQQITNRHLGRRFIPYTFFIPCTTATMRCSGPAICWVP